VGVPAAFTLYALASLLVTGFYLACVPEVTGKALEESVAEDEHTGGRGAAAAAGEAVVGEAAVQCECPAHHAPAPPTRSAMRGGGPRAGWAKMVE